MSNLISENQLHRVKPHPPSQVVLKVLKDQHVCSEEEVSQRPAALRQKQRNKKCLSFELFLVF